MRLARLVLPFTLLTAGAAATTSCATSPRLDAFAESPRTLRIEDYFQGQTTAYGVFEDRFNKVRRSFKVEMTGTLDGGTLTLDERFTYDDGEKDTRIWVIDVLGEGRYRGKANDVPEPAEGRAVGNAFNWRYKVDLKVGDSVWRVGFDDWMYLLEDNVVLNRAYVTRFGITIGEVTIAFRK
jgi:hypothetical protein